MPRYAPTADQQAIRDYTKYPDSGILTKDPVTGIWSDPQIQGLVSVAGIPARQDLPASINPHDLMIDGPVTRLDLVSPYSARYGSYNNEFAYGTPIYFPQGWKGYKYWLAGAPYPSNVSGKTVTIAIGASASITQAGSSPPPIGTAVSLSTTGALPTGLDTSTVYYVAATGYGDTVCQLSLTPGGVAVTTSGSQSGTQRLWFIGGQANITIGQQVIACAKALNSGEPVSFSTTGALPTGLVAGNVYWVLADGWSTQGFKVSATPGGAAITPTGSQSGAQAFEVYPPKYENPYILVSNDGEMFVPPPGMTQNPVSDVLGALATGTDLASYYADPYIVASPDQTKLYLAWHWFARGGANKSTILVSECSDGLTWSAPVAISNSTATTFTPNSLSLVPNPAGGWIMIAIDTGVGVVTPPYIYSVTASAEPYTGWAAPGAVYNGTWTQSVAPHPLGRTWWHQHTIPVEGGGLMSLCCDNGSAGGVAHVLVSWDSGATWSARALTAPDSAPGGMVYRPSACVVRNGAETSVELYMTSLGWPKSPNSLPLGKPGVLGYYVMKSRLKPGRLNDLMSRASLRDLVDRKPTGSAALTAGLALARDSFNRADGAVGSLDSGQAWTVVSGTFAIASNQLSCTANGSIVVDVGASNYEFEVRVVTKGGSNLMLLAGYVDSNNRLRMGISAGNTSVQRIVGGGVTYNLPQKPTPQNGDLLRVVKRGRSYSYYVNDQLAFSYDDTLGQASTIVGIQCDAGTVLDNVIATTA